MVYMEPYIKDILGCQCHLYSQPTAVTGVLPFLHSTHPSPVLGRLLLRHRAFWFLAESAALGSEQTQIGATT